MSERYEYLFLDIEWNQIEGTGDLASRDPVSIALIGADRILEQQKLFSKSICPKNFDLLRSQTCSIVHISEKALARSDSEQEVFTLIRKNFPVYRHVVVWTRESYDLFKIVMERYDLKMPRHRVIVLQDAIDTAAMQKGKQVNFPNALQLSQVLYRKDHLHSSKHDVNYLLRLYRKTYQEYCMQTRLESNIVNHRTKVIHTLDCPYARNTKLPCEKNAKRYIFQGYRPCSFCGSEAEWRKMHWVSQKLSGVKWKNYTAKQMRELPLNDDNIQMICRKFGMEYHISANMVFLQTKIGKWRIYYSDNTVTEVMHGNYRESMSMHKKKKKKFNEGFHKQEIKNLNTKSFYDVVEYIHYHDKRQVKQKKSRIDKLFDQIERENMKKLSY